LTLRIAVGCGHENGNNGIPNEKLKYLKDCESFLYILPSYVLESMLSSMMRKILIEEGRFRYRLH
jgi:hypothetical protein